MFLTSLYERDLQFKEVLYSKIKKLTPSIFTEIEPYQSMGIELF